MRLLLVEDEPGLREQLAARLRAQGYVVDATGEGREALYLGQEYPIDLALVDLGLPDLDGIQVIRRWRASGRAFPVLILTARGRWQEKVEGLEAGADDYLVKPFHAEELLARVRALLRRAGNWANPLLRCGPLELDTVAQRLRRSGEEVRLTSLEYRLLEYLMLHAGELLSRATLVEHCYEDGEDPDSNVLEVLIGRLRRKLDPDGGLRPIETLRGRGYRLALPRSDEG